MALGRLLRFSDEPKALLPWWLLVVVVPAGAFAGVGAHEAGAPGAVAAAVSVLVSAGSAALARRELARRGRRGFEDWPSADWEYAGDLKVGPLAELLNTAVLFGGGAAAGALVLATGMGHEDIWLFPAWLACGVLAAWPALDEVDARHALRVRRKREEEEARIRAAAGLDDRGDGREGDGPDETRHAPAAGGVITVPVNRAATVRWTLFLLAFAAGCGAVAVLSDDTYGRVVCGLAVPAAAIGAWGLSTYLRAPVFLRLTPSGAEILGDGEVPWSAIVGVDLAQYAGQRWLNLLLDEPVGDAMWATSAIRRAARRSKGSAVDLPMRFCAWPAEEVLAAVRAHGVEDIEVVL